MRLHLDLSGYAKYCGIIMQENNSDMSFWEKKIQDTEKQLFTEVEVASGGYLPRLFVARLISTTGHQHY